MIGVGPVAVWACDPIDLSLPRAHVPGDWWSRGIRQHPASVGNLGPRRLPTLCMSCNLCIPPEINLDLT
jgi:hypothetical protein